MKHKIFSLVLLGLLCSVGMSWADDTYYLQDPAKAGGSSPELTGDFYTTAELSFSVDKSYDAKTYKKGLTFVSNITSSSSNMKKPDAQVRYDCKTDDTEITVLVYSKKASVKFYYWTIQENATIGSACTVSGVTEKTADNGSIKAEIVSIKNSTRTSFYVTVGDRSNECVTQIIAVEKGTAFPNPGEAGYQLNFNNGRYFGASGSTGTIDATSSIDGVEMNQSQDYYYKNATTAKIKTKGTNYIKFKVESPMVLNFTTSSTAQYNVSTTKGSDADKITPTANTAKKINLYSADTYYINPQGSEVTPTGLSFSAAPVVTYNKNGGGGTMSSTYFTVAENGFSAPVVGQVFDGWKDGEGNDYEVGNDVESNVTLYAQWRTPATKHSVEYSLGAATGGTLPTQADVEEGQNFTVAAVPGDLVPPTGKRFKTWNDGSADYAPGADYKMSTSNVTLTAIYENIYAITEGTHDGGYITINKDIAAEAEVVTLTSTPKPGYSFTSWSITKTEDGSSTGISVSDNKFNMPAYAITVNAIFTKTDSRKQILYLTSTSESDTKEDDKLYAALNSVDDYNVIIAAPDDQTLTDYDLVVLHESIGGTNTTSAVTGCKTTSVPVLNTKSYFYGADGDASKRWTWGAPNAGKNVKGATQNSAFSNIASHPIFADLTVTDGFVEITDAEAAKCMQPIGSFSAGYEGYVLATTPNANSGNGTAIHEIPAGTAARGVSSGMYLLISVSSAKLNALNANGQRLFKNAAAYLIGGSSWTPTISATITSAGWATFSSAYALDLTDANRPAGLTAYQVKESGVNSTAKTIAPTVLNSTVAANTGLLLEGAEGTYSIPVVASGTDISSTNKMVAVTSNGININSADHFVLAYMNEEVVFAHTGTTAATLNKGQAYLNLNGVAHAPGMRIVLGENNATNIEAVEAAEEGVKFIQNGKLFIKKNGVVYDAMGRMIR